MSIRKFLFCSNEFSSTITLANEAHRENKINQIINALKYSNIIPDYLVKSKIKYGNGNFLFLDSFDVSESSPTFTNCNFITNNKIKLSRASINNIYKQYPIIKETLFVEDRNNLYSSMNKLISDLKLNKGFPNSISFEGDTFYSDKIATSSNLNYLTSEHATDIMFNLGQFDLFKMSEDNEELKSILEKGNDKLKLIESIYYLNYLNLSKRLQYIEHQTYKEYVENYIRNCFLIHSIVTLKDSDTLNVNIIEVWGENLINKLPPNSYYRKSCLERLLKLKQWKIHREINELNEIIHPNIISSINNMLSSIDDSTSLKRSKLEIVENLCKFVNNYKVDDNNFNRSKKMIYWILRAYFNSIQRNKMSYRLSPDCHKICNGEMSKSILKIIPLLQPVINVNIANNKSISETMTTQNHIVTEINNEISTFINNNNNNICKTCGDEEINVSINISGSDRQVCQNCLDKFIPELPTDIDNEYQVFEETPSITPINLKTRSTTAAKILKSKQNS